MSNIDYFYRIPSNKIDLLVYGSTIFVYIGMIIGIRLEYASTFESNERNWAQYNFEKETVKSKDGESSEEETLYLKKKSLFKVYPSAKICQYK